MQFLIDTGVLLRMFDRAAPERRTILAALRKLWAQDAELWTSVQNISEFWNVATRPAAARGGYGWSPTVADRRVRRIETMATVLPFSLTAYEQWRRLAVHHAIIGLAVHDARLVATMLCHGIHYILTYNVTDFRRYAGITSLTPDDFLASS